MTSLYIHIPFCKKKCNYCDFVSYAGKEDLIDEYIKALIRELQPSPVSTLANLPLPKGEGIKTIYFGGGTPTLLTPKHFNKIITTIISHSSSILRSCAAAKDELVIRHSEISVEANPGTADLAKLKALRQLGINRLSIGAQSFNDHHLKTLGRIHNSDDIFRFYDDARAAGFENINLDLIFALPGQSLSDWQSDLKQAMKLQPEHISAYSLQIEEGTPLFEQMTNYKLQMTNEETDLAMYEYTIETLTNAGYKHYEISNFSKPNFECQHNMNYWRNGNYLGIGAGAHSHINGKRWANSNNIEEYLKNATRITPDDSQDATDQRTTIFMGLRLLDGLLVDKFLGFEKEVSELIENGLLMRKNNHYKLTKRGLYLANEVFSMFV